MAAMPNKAAASAPLYLPALTCTCVPLDVFGLVWVRSVVSRRIATWCDECGLWAEEILLFSSSSMDDRGAEERGCFDGRSFVEPWSVDVAMEVAP